MVQTPQKIAGMKLAELIKEHYKTRENFAFQRCYSERTLSRYVNEGIDKLSVIQEFAEIFDVELSYFFYTLQK